MIILITIMESLIITTTIIAVVKGMEIAILQQAKSKLTIQLISKGKSVIIPVKPNNITIHPELPGEISRQRKI